MIQELKWHSIPKDAKLEDNGDGTLSIGYQVHTMQIDTSKLFPKYGKAKYKNCIVVREKNKRKTFARLDSGNYIFMSEKIEVVQDEETKRIMELAGWKYKGRNLWKIETLYHRDTIKMISEEFDRLENNFKGG